jgi:hypothetical protein
MAFLKPPFRGNAHNGFMRAIAFTFLFIAAASLVWDAFSIYSGRRISGFSTIIEIWNSISLESYRSAECFLSELLGFNLWLFGVKPALNVPLAPLAVLPGLFFYLRSTAEIKLYSPSAWEVELMQAGYTSREIRHLRRH